MKKYLVGGAVRDKLLGRDSMDNDFVVVGATPQEMLDLGYKNVGESFPVFLHPETGDEYALARKERKTGVGYGGFSVEFDTSVTLAEDLSRRDLTINAMAMDLDTGELVDPFGGEEDLRRGVLRHVGTAFVEDPLRVVRLARFFARYTEFHIAHETFLLVQQIVDSGEMNALSNERFWVEMEKTLSQGGNPLRFFHALMDFGVLGHVDFFKDAFGVLSEDDLEVDVANYLTEVEELDEEHRMPMFVGLTARNDAKQVGSAFPLRAKKLTENMRVVRAMHVPTPEKVFELINMNRGWSAANRNMNDLISGMSVALRAGESLSLSPFVLRQAALIGGSIKADAFLHMPGSEIGKAMAREKLRAVRDVMMEMT